MTKETDPSAPGYKTTEAIVPIVSGVLGSLVAFGILTPEEQTGGTRIVSEAVGSLTALCGMAIYVWGRIRIKVEKIKNMTAK